MLSSENDKLIPACQQERRSGLSVHSFLKILDLKYISNMLKKSIHGQHVCMQEISEYLQCLGTKHAKNKNKIKSLKIYKRKNVKEAKKRKKK